MAIKIITDSTADIPRSLVDELNIEVLPLTVNFPNKSYKDNGLELTDEEFFKKLKESSDLPTTSQVSPGEFVTVFEKHLEKYDEIICVDISSDMSGTFNAAIQAKNIIDSDRIHVIDSRMVSFAFGFVVVEAAKMAKENRSVDEIVEFAKNAHTKINNMFIFDTLDYLLKGGRLSKKEALLGSLLNIKPIITLVDGELKSLHKARGRKKAISYLINQLKEDCSKHSIDKIALYRGVDSDMFEEIKKIINSEFEFQEILESKLGIVVGTHAGPGAIAISYFREE
ncbi:MAG: DegV family protein [Clostridiales bacterium]|nr:DegV family protein [Clostridiales bacterium]